MSMRGHKNAKQDQEQDEIQAEVEDTYEYCACKRKTTAESGEWRMEGRECLQLIAFGCFTIR